MRRQNDSRGASTSSPIALAAARKSSERSSHQLVAVELGELGTLDLREAQRLRVERLLEERAGEARVPEALAAPGFVEDRAAASPRAPSPKRYSFSARNLAMIASSSSVA